MELLGDFVDLLAAFAKHKVRYLLIGGYAVGFYARPRATKDIDLWLDPGDLNIVSACEALAEFGAPLMTIEGLKSAKPDEIVWLGSPPGRVDFLLSVVGGVFSDAYDRRHEDVWQSAQGESVPVCIVSKSDLIALKRAAGRPQDLADIDALT